MGLFAAVLFISGIAFKALGEIPPSSESKPERPADEDREAIEAPAPAPKFEVEWSQGELFVGATDGSTTATHGYQKLDGSQPATAMIHASSGLSLVAAHRGEDGFRFRFDEARLRYFVKLFGAEGRVLRIFVVYPDQAEISISHEKLPAGPVYLSVHNEADHPLQNFKLAFPMGATDSLATMARNGI